MRNLTEHDPYFVLADYADYIATQDRVAVAYRDAEDWSRRSILTVARMGRFSSDRAIREYCRDIWEIGPVPVAAEDRGGVAKGRDQVAGRAAIH